MGRGAGRGPFSIIEDAYGDAPPPPSFVEGPTIVEVLWRLYPLSEADWIGKNLKLNGGTLFRGSKIPRTGEGGGDAGVWQNPQSRFPGYGGFQIVGLAWRFSQTFRFTPNRQNKPETGSGTKCAELGVSKNPQGLIGSPIVIGVRRI